MSNSIMTRTADKKELGLRIIERYINKLMIRMASNLKDNIRLEGRAP
jgi:hypothetical protein